MSWNYRVVRDVHQVGDEEHEQFTIREVYYKDGEISSWTVDACYPSGDTWLECVDDHAIMGRAAVLPVVDISSGKAVEVEHRLTDDDRERIFRASQEQS